MRFGVCASFEHLHSLAAAGYDYVEASVAPVLKPEQPEEAILPGLQESLAASSLTPEAFNVFLPGDLKVVGPQVDAPRQERYLTSAFARVASLGGKIVVFGSGGSRNVPEGVDRANAERQIVEFLRRAGPLAAAQNVTVAIEPLNRGECNIINSVAEGMEYVQAVSHPNIQVLSDLYHVALEGQSFEETRAAGPALRHVHVAGAEGRRAPNAEDVDYLTPYFRVLKEMGYDGRVSVEGGWTDLPGQAAETLDVLHRAWDGA